MIFRKSKTFTIQQPEPDIRISLRGKERIRMYSDLRLSRSEAETLLVELKEALDNGGVVGETTP